MYSGILKSQKNKLSRRLLTINLQTLIDNSICFPQLSLEHITPNCLESEAIPFEQFAITMMINVAVRSSDLNLF